MIGRKYKPKEARPEWIQFKDKIFDINNKTIFKATPEYFFTNPIPHEIGSNKNTPFLDKLFESWVGKNYVNTLYEIIAYCCYRDYPIHSMFG